VSLQLREEREADGFWVAKGDTQKSTDMSIGFGNMAVIGGS
jgi:hypothetical protein